MKEYTRHIDDGPLYPRRRHENPEADRRRQEAEREFEQRQRVEQMPHHGETAHLRMPYFTGWPSDDLLAWTNLESNAVHSSNSPENLIHNDQEHAADGLLELQQTDAIATSSEQQQSVEQMPYQDLTANQEFSNPSWHWFNDPWEFDDSESNAVHSPTSPDNLTNNAQEQAADEGMGPQQTNDIATFSEQQQRVEQMEYRDLAWGFSDSESNAVQSSISPGNLANNAQEHAFDGGWGPQLIDVIGTSSSRNKLKRRADWSPPAPKRRRSLAWDFFATPSSSEYHIPELLEPQDQPAEDTVPNNPGILARNIGQEVRRRANASGRKKAKPTAVTHVQPTTPPEVTDIAIEAPERAESANAPPKTESKNRKESAKMTLRNPAVVIYRDPELHKEYIDAVNYIEEPGNSTVQSPPQRVTDSLPRTKTQKKPAKSKVNQQPLNTKGRVSKTSKPSQKRSRKTTVDITRQTPSRLTRSHTDRGHTKHVSLDAKGKSKMDLTEHGHHVVQGGSSSIFG